MADALMTNIENCRHTPQCMPEIACKRFTYFYCLSCNLLTSHVREKKDRDREKKKSNAEHKKRRQSRKVNIGQSPLGNLCKTTTTKTVTEISLYTVYTLH